MSIFVSDSPYGPWTQQMPWVVAGSGTQEIDGVPWAKGARYVGGNPTALILENGTTLVFFRGGGGSWSQCQKLGVSVKSFSANCTGPNDPNCPKDKVNGCAFRLTGITRPCGPCQRTPALELLTFSCSLAPSHTDVGAVHCFVQIRAALSLALRVQTTGPAPTRLSVGRRSHSSRKTSTCTGRTVAFTLCSMGWTPGQHPRTLVATPTARMASREHV